MNLYNYSNLAVETTLSGNVNSIQTTMTVGLTTGFPTLPYVLAVDYGAITEELVKVTAAAGTTLTIERGFSGTSAQDHSLGAKVRHVWHAGDATDFRTHEAAMATVHGVSGDLVGTSDVQSLSNKTLTSPTISAGALSGTFTGAPTFSGNVAFSGTPAFSGSPVFTGTPSFVGATFSGEPTLSGGALLSRASGTDLALRALVSGDVTNRVAVQADGAVVWSSGAAAADTTLYREAADTLTTDDTLRVYRPTAAGDAVTTRVTGDTSSRWVVDADGAMSWGPGGAAAVDTNLYRSAANTLKTDDAFEAANFPAGAWTTYTPTWSADTGTTTLGNGTLAGRYTKIGRTVFFSIRFEWGSTTTQSTSGANWTLALPVAAYAGLDNTWQPVNVWILNASSSIRWDAKGYVNATDQAVRTIVVHADDASMDNEAMPSSTAESSSTTSLKPGSVNWGNGDRINIWGFYESAA